MSAASPRCGRLDDHAPHTWTRPSSVGLGEPVALRTHDCSGVVVTEGGQVTVCCQRASAACRCDQDRADEQNAEWWADA